MRVEVIKKCKCLDTGVEVELDEMRIYFKDKDDRIKIKSVRRLG